MSWFGSSKSHKVPEGLHFGREIPHQDRVGHRKLLLVRHGQTDFNVQHRLPGQLPGIPLNEEGKSEVKATAEALRSLPITAIIASPLERTLETAACINEGRGLEIHQDRDLLDTDYGRFSGQNFEELDQKDPEWGRFNTDALYTPKGVESFARVQARAVRATERWRNDDHVGEWVALVTHADLVKLIIAHYLGIPIGNVPLFSMDNAAVSLLTFHPAINRPPSLLSFNWTSPALWLQAAKAQ